MSARDDRKKADGHGTAPSSTKAAETAPQATAPATAAPGAWALTSPSSRPDRGELQRQALQLQRLVGNQQVSRMIQRAATGTPAAPDGLVDRLDARAGSGKSLDLPLREQLERGIGANLSRVRLHDDSEADRLARSVDAVAFSTGNDIYLSHSAPRSDTPQGLWLMGHEAAHTVQQSAGAVSGTDLDGGVRVSEPGDAFEQAADRAADHVLMGTGPVSSVGPGSGASAGNQLQRLRPDELPEDEAAASQGTPSGTPEGAAQEDAAGQDAAGSDDAAAQHSGDGGGAVAAPQSIGAPVAPAGGGPNVATGFSATGAASAVAQDAHDDAEADAENTSEASMGEKPQPGKKNPIPSVGGDAKLGKFEQQQLDEEPEEESAGGGHAARQVQTFARAERGRLLQRWTASREIEGFIDLWPTNLQVKMKNAPTIVVGRYNGAWAPNVYFDHEYGWDTHSGPSGHYYINGQEHASWDAEDEWTQLRGVPKTSLQQPGPDDFAATNNTQRATFVTRPDFHTDDRTVAAQETFATYRSGLASRPRAQSTSDSFDRTNIISVGEFGGGPAGSRAAQTVTANITQSVQTTTSTTATGAFAHTTTTATETSAGAEGSAGGERPAGGGKDTWGLKASLGRRWTDTEQEQAQRSLAEVYAEVSTSSQSYTVPFTIPAGVPAVAMIVPSTRRITSEFPAILDVSDDGIVERTGSDTRVAESNVPKGYVAIYGYDREYVTALGGHYEACRAIRQGCEGLRGRGLESKKNELREHITQFSSTHTPSYQRALAHAMEQLNGASPTAGAQAPPASVPAADNVARWHNGIEEFFRYASGATPPG
jgi:hypothetical protein